jgi:molybdate transport system substrate-binding protein
MKHLKTLLVTASILLLAASLPAAQVMVFAAASLTDALKQIAADYEKDSGDQVVFNFAASGPLARQIEAGAPADIFFSADEARADVLEKKGLLVTETRVSRLGNTLVLVAAADSTAIHTPADLTNAVVKRVAIGDAKTVPAGTYTLAYLEKQGLWEPLAAKTVPCESVRAVLAAVESGNVEAGFVYQTDAAISKKVKTVYAVPAADAPKITYPMALLKEAPQPEAAKKFLAYLAGEKAGDVFAHYGFIVLPTGGAH